MMRTVAITIHNNHKFELFVEKRRQGFEFWVVGPAKGHRMLLDHHVTHDDLEARLEYAQAGDLIWRDAVRSEMPAEKHQNAIEMEETIRLDTFWDFEKLHQSVTGHLGAISFLMMDKAEWNAAKKAVVGRWTDGVVTMSLEPSTRLRWSCVDRQHPLNIVARVHGHAPDWWNFAAWRLHLMNSERKCGTHIGVLRVDEQVLHLDSGHPHRMARVFHRDKTAEQRVEEATVSSESLIRSPKRAKANHVGGKTTPLLRRLEQAVIGRNPLLAERLKAGLLESDIRAALSQAKVAGAIEPLIRLYSWRNGTALDEQTPMGETSFFPQDIYRFMDLKEAIATFEEMNRAAATLRGIFLYQETDALFSGFTGQLFPLFRDGASGSIAVDLSPSKQNRVVVVEFESTEPVRQAYGSFDEFLNDAIRANREDSSLACFSHEKSG